MLHLLPFLLLSHLTSSQSHTVRHQSSNPRNKINTVKSQSTINMPFPRTRFVSIPTYVLDISNCPSLSHTHNKTPSHTAAQHARENFGAKHQNVRTKKKTSQRQRLARSLNQPTTQTDKQTSYKRDFRSHTAQHVIVPFHSERRRRRKTK